MRFLPGPGKTLLLLVGAAAVVLVGGLRVAHREKSVRVERGHAAAERFTDEAQEQLRRLERAYERHLTLLARETPGDPLPMRVAANRIVGVREFSLLHPARQRERDQHVSLVEAGEPRAASPTFAVEKVGSGGAVPLNEAALLGGEEDSGWIEEPGQRPMFFLRRASDELAVLTVDAQATQAAVGLTLREWAATAFAPLRTGKGADVFRTAGGETLAVGGKPGEGLPDRASLLRNRLGAWELASWDERVVRASDDPATLAVTAVLTILIAGLGGAAFVQQRRALRDAAQRVSFVNRVSHELRTPLTNILLNVDLAADAAEEAPDEAVRRLGLVQEEARRLGRLIDNVLALPSPGRTVTPGQSGVVTPARMIAGVVEQFAPAFQRRGLRVRCEGGVETACRLDADALAQILANLLSNAEKYAARGTVEIASAWREGRLTVRVSDEGPGVPADAAERIFLPFERLNSRVNEGVAGAGLGLAIARELAARLGGTLRLVPSQRGAAFELTVAAPLASAAFNLSTSFSIPFGLAQSRQAAKKEADKKEGRG